jgi:hypothetical protein
LAGIIIGPTIAAFFLSVWQMAEKDFKSEAVPPDPTVEPSPEP